MKKVSLLLFATLMLVGCNICNEPLKKDKVEITFLDGSRDTITIEYKRVLGMYDNTIVDYRNYTYATGVKYFEVLTPNQ